LATIDPLDVDELDGRTLVVEGISALDDGQLTWMRRAPCVVIGVTPDGEEPSSHVDVALRPSSADDELAALVARIEASPQASRVLVDVLRTMPDVDVPTGLTIESLAYSALLAGPEFARWLAARPERPAKTFASAPVRVELEDGRLRVTLARPENRNAFSAVMRDALFEALSAAEVDEVGIESVEIRGDGPVFSSGGDLTEFGTAPDVARAHEIRTQRSVGALIARLGPKVAVQVHGDCVGAGVELPAFAGRVVAAPGTTFRLPEISMGLIPGAGGTVSITRRIGRQATAELALLGDPIDAATAFALGLVDEVREP
jgi:enoyl-CoA hydratase/carnithine racemase